MLGWPLLGRVLVGGASGWCVAVVAGWWLGESTRHHHRPLSPPTLPPAPLACRPHPPSPPPPPEGEQGRILKREAAVHMSNAKLTATAAAE